MLFVDVLAILVFVLLLVLITASTVYDVIVSNQPYEPKKIYIAFSLRTNIEDLVKNEANTIGCLHGLRAISAFWVVGGHRMFRADLMTSQPVESSILGQVIIAILMTNDYAVDVFFLVSGVLVAKSSLKSLDRKNFNLPKLYFMRYMRYIPTLAVLLLFFMSSLQLSLVDGLNVNVLKNMIAACYDYWWSSLLLVQNYVNVQRICMNVTWYLSVDFQLFLLSPLFVYLLWKFKYKTLWLFGVITVVSQVSSSCVSMTQHVVYRHTHFRIAQFLFGIALGYIMYEQEGKFHMRRRSQTIGWILTLSSVFAVEVFHETLKSEAYARALYDAIHRITWVCLISWIVFTCHHLKSGGFVNKFLSLRFWKPFSRMSLSIYLIHYIYIIMTAVNMKELWFMESAWLIHIVLGDFLAATFFGAILYLMIEAPSNAVLKYYLK